MLKAPQITTKELQFTRTAFWTNGKYESLCMGMDNKVLSETDKILIKKGETFALCCTIIPWCATDALHDFRY
jgi:hypothetical protein